jgi:hypothetical protein
MSDYLMVAEVYRMQHRLIELFGGLAGVRDKAAVFRPLSCAAASSISPRC